MDARAGALKATDFESMEDSPLNIKVTVRSTADADIRLALREIDLIPDRMLAIAEQGAEVLRQTDPYQDRTGNLRESTEAVMTERGDPTTVELRMSEAYASFVQRNGFSNFDEVAEEVADQIDEGLRAVAKRI